jgi:carbon-monoxide dehydrogenase medium subunit
MKILVPHHLNEALEMKQQYGDQAQVLAGGQSLSVLLQKRLVSPEVLIYLGEIEELNTLIVSEEQVRFGAMVTNSRLEYSQELKKIAPLLSHICSVVASPHVRNLGTVIGNLCHAEVGTDPPQALLALDAQICASSVKGTRWIPAIDFITDFFETTLEEDEIATEIKLSPTKCKSTYFKHKVRSMDLAIASVAIAIQIQDDKIASARLAIGGIGPKPIRALNTESSLIGITPEAAIENADHFGSSASIEANPSLSDSFAPAKYRKHLVRIAVSKGIRQIL